MREQKFKRGNLVKMLYGHYLWTPDGQIDMCPENVGRLAIIEYSWNDELAEEHGYNDREIYSVMWQDTGGTEAWKDPEQMELIDEGGEHLLRQPDSTKNELS